MDEGGDPETKSKMAVTDLILATEYHQTKIFLLLEV